MSASGGSGGFVPPTEPGKLNLQEICELNQMYVGNVQQLADINTRNTEQIAAIIKGTRIAWLV